MIQVEIDSQSGFCNGVVRAIGNAEKFLDAQEGSHLYSLGEIVHNEAELSRLAGKGLVSIDKADLDQMVNAKGETLLIRAHGEPPSTYKRVTELGFEVIDCTCPVVLSIQKQILQAYRRLHSDGIDGQVIIFGKIGHAEVLGLVGQVGGDALVVENEEQLTRSINGGLIQTGGPVEIFSQTTMSPDGYERVCGILSEAMADPSLLTVHKTICRQVASRHAQLSTFARSHDVVVFVSGKSSSNGKVLSELCRSVNIRTYHVAGISDIKREWFRTDDKVGVCGATSTPKWLLDEVASFIGNLQ